MKQVDDWIQREVFARDFADVGGLWGLANEKVSCAAKAGARSITMIDITAPDDDLWPQFREKCVAAGVDSCRCLSMDVLDDNLIDLAGRFDVVHCSGLLYHCPEPLRLLVRLREMCRGTLMLGSTVIPSSFRNGPIACAPGGALFVPALGAEQRLSAADYFRQVGAKTMQGLDTEEQWDEQTYHPWWWLFTREHVRAIIEVAGFVLTDTYSTWEDRVVYFRAVPQSNQGPPLTPA